MDIAKAQFKDYVQWVMDNYDTNKDGVLNEKETKALLDDAMKINVKLDDVTVWINRFDFDNDGNLSIREVADALDLI
jgi:Ca2+-binding EF-hand superfamily protein